MIKIMKNLQLKNLNIKINNKIKINNLKVFIHKVVYLIINIHSKNMKNFSKNQQNKILFFKNQVIKLLIEIY